MWHAPLADATVHGWWHCMCMHVGPKHPPPYCQCKGLQALPGFPFPPSVFYFPHQRRVLHSLACKLHSDLAHVHPLVCNATHPITHPSITGICKPKCVIAPTGSPARALAALAWLLRTGGPVGRQQLHVASACNLPMLICSSWLPLWLAWCRQT